MTDKLDVSILEATLGGIMLPFGLEVSRITIEGNGLSIQKEPLEFRLAAPGKIEIVVDDEALADFLNHKAPGGLRNVKLRLEDGKIHVNATVKMLFEVAASAICTLRIVDGTELYVDLEKVDVMGVGASNLVQKQLDAINPVLNMRDLPVDATIDEVIVDDGVVRMRGKVAPNIVKSKSEQESAK